VPGPVHTGLTADPPADLTHLFDTVDLVPHSPVT